MDFYEQLAQMGKINMIYSTTFKEPVFSTEDLVLDAFEDILNNNKKTLAYGDYDFDGAASLLLLCETFDYLQFTNYEAFRYVSRTHDIDTQAVNKAINEGFEYMIICDAGSHATNIVMRLSAMGVKVILLDHHESVYSYSDFRAAMINTTFENRLSKEEYLLSAGALTYIVCNKLIKRRGKPEHEGLSAIALASMYADSIDMSTDLARGIYYKATSLKVTKIPAILQRFMGEYDQFNRKYISFKIAPRINSLFRAEKFDLLNKFLFWKPGNGSVSGIVDEINTTYEKYRDAVKIATDIVEHKVLNNFVIANLSSVAKYIDIEEDKLHNYTGLVANNLQDRYKKTAVVYADSGVDVKGSLRDPYARNYLDLFKTFCKCGGHPSAFGIHVGYMDFANFINYIELIDKQFFIKNIGNEPLLIPHNKERPDKEMMIDMSRYNEFSGSGAPLALVTKKWLTRITPYGNGYYKRYKWGDFYIKSNSSLEVGNNLIIKPSRGYRNDKKDNDVDLEVTAVK